MAKRTEPESVEPHSLEAERSVLGAIILHNDAYERARTILQPGDFYRHAHTVVYDTMARLLDGPGFGVDLVTLTHALKVSGHLEDIGGPTYLAGLIDGVPRSTNVDHYATIVKEQAQLRQLAQIGRQLTDDALTGQTPARQLASDLDRSIVVLQDGALSTRLRPIAESVEGLMEDIRWRQAHKGELTGVTSGFREIDALTGGWQAGELIVLGAFSSIGKSTWAMDSAILAAEADKAITRGRRNRVAVFSLEMTRRQLENRLLSYLSGVELSRIIGGYVRDLEWPRVASALERFTTADLMIEDRAEMTARDIRSLCRLKKADGGLDLVVIDYFQLLRGMIDRRGATRNEELTDASRRLKLMAQELDVAVVVLSQLNRASESRVDPRPRLSDLRDCGALGQDADIVAFLYRKNHRENGHTEFIIEKQRNGPTGSVNLTFVRETSMFIEGGEPPKPEPKQPETPEEAHARKTRAIIAGRKK